MFIGNVQIRVNFRDVRKNWTDFAWGFGRFPAYVSDEVERRFNTFTDEVSFAGLEIWSCAC